MLIQITLNLAEANGLETCSSFPKNPFGRLYDIYFPTWKICKKKSTKFMDRSGKIYQSHGNPWDFHVFVEIMCSQWLWTCHSCVQYISDSISPPPKFNMSPEEGWFYKEISSSNHQFSGDVSCQAGTSLQSASMISSLLQGLVKCLKAVTFGFVINMHKI